MKKPHKHAELIKAWADRANIQWYDSHPRWHRWIDCGQNQPSWREDVQFRIKPEPKPDVTDYYCVQQTYLYMASPNSSHNLKLTFDGETGKLKSAEVI